MPDSCSETCQPVDGCAYGDGPVEESDDDAEGGLPPSVLSSSSLVAHVTATRLNRQLIKCPPVVLQNVGQCTQTAPEDAVCVGRIFRASTVRLLDLS